MVLPPDQDWLRSLAEGPTADVARILLVGWEGTLAPHSAGPQPTLLPAEVTAVVGPLVAEAMDSVRAALAHRVVPCVKNARSLENLEAALRRRLSSVYTLPVALGRMHVSSSERERADRISRMLAEDWVAGVELFLVRLMADRERIAQWMGVAAPPSIVSLRSAASDIHGRSGGVIEIEFVGGKKIFYKPRPVTGELLWAELNAAIAVVDEGAQVLAARALVGGVNDQSGYGWMEALTPGDCDALKHWRRAGALLCLAQHVGMSDLHMSNIMATAGGPAVLDAECLGDPTGLSEGVADAAEQMLATGLLPGGRDNATELLPDVSGLFGAGADVRGVLVPQWSSSPAGGAAVSFAAGRLLDQTNLHAARRMPLACLPEMLEGYLRCARVLSSIRHDLLREGGWVDRLDKLHSPRVVLRDTLTYGWLMSRSLASGVIGPVESRRAALRRMLLETPCALPLSLDAGLLEVEVETLLRLCVPRFGVPSGTCDVVCEDGRLLLRDALPCTPATVVRRRIEAMSLGEFGEDVTSALSAILFRARALDR